MQGSRIVLALGAAVVLAYAALTAWPAIEALFRKSAPASAKTAPVLPNNVPGARLNAAAGNPVPPFRPNPGSPPPAPGVLAPPSSALRQRRKDSHAIDLGHMSTYASWTYDSSIVRYASRDVEMLNRPGGNGLPPVSLNHAPLVILRGTRLLPMEERGEWVMVRSPSSALGWVHKNELTEQQTHARGFEE